jgi:outer membrane protein OmpA-like peptidoglycan-associated protein
LFFVVRAHQRWDAYVNRLRQQPGIVVTAAEKRGSRYQISGLRDPLAADAGALLLNSGIPADRVAFHWEPYLSSDPRFAAVHEFEARRSALQRQALYFPVDQSRISPEQLTVIGNVAADMRDLFRRASATGRQIRIEVLGYTDNLGAEQHNKLLAQARAERVTAALVADGVPAAQLTAGGAGTGEVLGTGTAEDQSAVRRSVTFRVVDGS